VPEKNIMFGLFDNKLKQSEPGGELYKERKKKEKIWLIVYAIVSIIVFNIILYILSTV
jgi:hypothetical protein